VALPFEKESMMTEFDREDLVSSELDALLRFSPDGLLPLEIQDRFELPDGSKETFLTHWRMHRGGMRSGRMQHAVQKAIHFARNVPKPCLVVVA
jgi:hypothetical protein